MIKTSSFVDHLKEKNIKFYSGVPCSILKDMLNVISNTPELKYIPAVKENVALGIASGAYLAGKRSCVLMQNSGLGNIINALTSFNAVYKIPVLMFITWRGFDQKDAPQHLVMGKKTTVLLDSLNVPYRVLTDSYKDDINWAVKKIDDMHMPVAIIIKKGCLK